MKNVIAYSLFGVLLILAACGGDSSTPSDPAINSGAESEISSSSEQMASFSSSSRKDNAYSSFQGNGTSSFASTDESSSSENSEGGKSSSSWIPTVLPPGKYDCSVYNCVTTDHLNPEFTYGELLDERDNQVYRTIKIGDQWWMAQNLNYDYNEGKGKSFCYDNDSENCVKYGRLYTWEAAIDSAGLFNKNCKNGECIVHPYRGVCPEGWFLPIGEDIEQFMHFNIMGILAKGFELWSEALDSYGFSAVPSGGFYDDEYFGLGQIATLWSASRYRLEFGYGGSYDYISSNEHPAYSVRCYQDSSIVYAKQCKNELEDKCEYGTLTDSRDGKTYKTVVIANQTVMAENLKFEYRLENEVTMFCGVDSLDECEKNGPFYTWTAAVDSAGLFSDDCKDCGQKGVYPKQKVRGICPEGWHIPNKTEWTTLYKSMGSLQTLAFASGYNKRCDVSDAYGFSVVPAGIYLYQYYNEAHSYYNNGNAAFWLSSNLDGTPYSWQYYKNEAKAEEERSFNGLSVRCFKDVEP